RRATPADSAGFLRLVNALADFEKLDPPDEAAQKRLLNDAFSDRPRFDAWLAFVDGIAQPVGYAIFLETYSSFLALPSLYIEDVFVLSEYRQQGIGGALLRKAVELAKERGCGRVEWTALDWNANARRVYEEKMGAQHMNEWCLYRMDDEAMARHLAK
ncbi:MAG: GCN5-related N-acetyltransferase, partial [Verrucomicrobiaceae bacterium]|nr:GCN5-related N-acetyltransferase [Verrucomicrobiaceae bacterium]